MFNSTSNILNRESLYAGRLIGGRYYCTHKIGQGGMSEVYACMDRHIGKEWALKVISKPSGNSSLINSEINLLKSLDYYMFPRIVDAFIYEDNYIIVSDYIKGQSFEDYIKKNGPLPIDKAVEYLQQLLDAIIYLHDRSPSILYLDMKPANIMLQPDGTVCLIDFGIARSILTKNLSFGSVGYSPPEQYVAGTNLNEKADVFALLMTFYSLITGDKPLANLKRQTEKIKSDMSIPKHLRELILKCIHPDESKRPMPKEIRKELMRNESKNRSLMAVALTALVVCMAFFLVIGLAINMTYRYRRGMYAREMVEKASMYIEDGEYTLPGVKILCGYIDGGFLDEKSQQQFTFIVARNYFEIQKDYVSAKNYFSRLDDTDYPEKGVYMQLCRCIGGFSEGEESVGKIIDDFEKYNNSLPEGLRKENNRELIEYINSEIIAKKEMAYGY